MITYAITPAPMILILEMLLNAMALQHIPLSIQQALHLGSSQLHFLNAQEICMGRQLTVLDQHTAQPAGYLSLLTVAE
jgi:hypothetical protein